MHDKYFKLEKLLIKSDGKKKKRFYTKNNKEYKDFTIG